MNLGKMLSRHNEQGIHEFRHILSRHHEQGIHESRHHEQGIHESMHNVIWAFRNVGIMLSRHA